MLDIIINGLAADNVDDKQRVKRLLSEEFGMSTDVVMCRRLGRQTDRQTYILQEHSPH